MDLNYQPSMEVVRLIGELDEFKGAWRSFASLSPERLSELKKIATIESIGSSTRIEGVRLTDSEVEKFLQGELKATSFKSRDGEEVAGYADLMETIFENYESIPITENHIKQLHAVLLKYSQKDKRHRGNYKTVSNQVIAFEDGVSVGVVFDTVSPFDTPYRMQELVAWTRDELERDELHPLLVVAVFVVRFLAIHPFQDGNGRLSRALTTLLLLRKGYYYVPYSSMEAVIEKNKDSYYLTLRKTQTSFDTETIDWESWIKFFLQTMKKQKDLLSEKVRRERKLQPDLPELGIQVLELLRQHGRLKCEIW
ncbi:MAG: Fic family protein [Cyanobacteriota/Melainabacteria group bacterium]